ncbi:pentapeptide repeat-containing protein [Nocardia panacis]|nr:pentapeptide repeat-containing protein [Nocardia panacis]
MADTMFTRLLQVTDRLGAPSPLVRANALRMLEPWLSGPNPDDRVLVLGIYADILRHRPTPPGNDLESETVLDILHRRLGKTAEHPIPPMNLTGVALPGTDLRALCLPGARLSNADLRRADLRGAFLADADLRGANLTEANLAGAHLTNADLTGTRCDGANLREADLAGATMIATSLEATDLTDAHGAPRSLRDTVLTAAKGLSPDRIRDFYRATSEDGF